MSDSAKRQCSLLLFVATSSEEAALKQVALEMGLTFEKVKDAILGQYGWSEYHWMGEIGNETVAAVRPTREGGGVVMGAHGRLGVAAKAIRFREETAAQAIVQIGMAFGIDPTLQQLGDVIVSSSLIPYDNRTVRPTEGGYINDYSQAIHEPARPALVNLFLREQKRGQHPFAIHTGSVLSGAARIHSSHFRNELKNGVPPSDDQIVGGEMEGVGLLAASTNADDPVWCVVKGISDFADENRDKDIITGKAVASRNAAKFVLSALVNDRKRD